MLSRIPLLMMYKAARINGVPLKLELASAAAVDRFALKAETITAFNDYIATCTEKSGPLHRIMHEQQRKQVEWRLFRRVTGNSPLHKSASFLRATTFDQNDLYSAGCEFEKEVAEFTSWVAGKGKGFSPTVQKPGLDDGRSVDWTEMATWWGKVPKPSAAVLRFFDDYVHDSHAWFKVIPGNPDNEKDMHEKLAALGKPRPSYVDAKAGGIRTSTSSVEEQRVADEYAKTGKIPRMTTAGREPLWLNAGYLRFRKIYDGVDWQVVSALSGTAAAAVNAGKEAAEHAVDDVKNGANRIYNEAGDWAAQQQGTDYRRGY
jgi:hypothetical protein